MMKMLANAYLSHQIIVGSVLLILGPTKYQIVNLQTSSSAIVGSAITLKITFVPH